MTFAQVRNVARSSTAASGGSPMTAAAPSRETQHAHRWPAAPQSIPPYPVCKRERGNSIVDDPVAEVPTQAKSGDTGEKTGAGQQQGAQALDSQNNVPRAGKVTAVTLIDSATGALSGFPAITNTPDLNSPGPFNDTSTGACQNVQQIKFDLSGIPSNEVDLTRTKDGVAGTVGQEQPRKGLDGPSDPTKLRKGNMIAVADSPGIVKANSGFPLRYAISFQLYAFDILSKAILAKATYKVNILKQSQGDPKPVNELTDFKSNTY